jgi:prepilin-type N-terminal cleavage/methylation domain-containing protein
MAILEQKASGNQKGFALMELMATTIIVGTLAAVAVPLYALYVQKAKITEATNEFSENPDQCTMTYRHNRANDPVGEWACDGTCITRNIILRQ